jgi:hypothetical protein
MGFFAWIEVRELEWHLSLQAFINLLGLQGFLVYFDGEF